MVFCLQITFEINNIINKAIIFELIPLPFTLQGTDPFFWRKVTGPPGMSIVRGLGRISWKAVASSDPHNVTVECNNIYGTDQLNIQIIVEPTYTASFSPVKFRRYPKSFPLVLSGNVTHKVSSIMKNTTVPVIIV